MEYNTFFGKNNSIIEFNSFLKRCNEDDVLELDAQMVKLSKLNRDLNLALKLSSNSDVLLALAKDLKTTPLSNTTISQLFSADGANANILCIGSQGWRTGKIKLKITLEFCPDEPDIETITPANNAEINQPESPLDDIRRMMIKDN